MRISEIQKGWRILDEKRPPLPEGISLISHETFTPCPGFVVHTVSPNWLVRFLRRVSASLASAVYAIQLLRSCKKSTVLLLNGGSFLWWYVGVFNRIPFVGNRCVCLWDVFVEVERGWKQKLVAFAMKGMTLSVLWSKAQIGPHARFLGMDEDRFVFLPFKANHSKNAQIDFPENQFVFSGGNGKRDYECLVNAIEGTGIPLVISATNEHVRNSIRRLPNVILIAASEPAFAQLQAASAFVIYALRHTGLKGGGEANFCNGMWHGKPVIAADSIAASDYIVDGVTGYVVPAGDTEALRARILRLWRDPQLVRKMGSAARQYASENFTHVKFIRRLLTLATVLGLEFHSEVTDADCQQEVPLVNEGDGPRW